MNRMQTRNRFKHTTFGPSMNMLDTVFSSGMINSIIIIYQSFCFAFISGWWRAGHFFRSGRVPQTFVALSLTGLGNGFICRFFHSMTMKGLGFDVSIHSFMSRHGVRTAQELCLGTMEIATVFFVERLVSLL